MRILLKIGGTLLDQPESRLSLAHQIGTAFNGGLDLVVVHGGGRQMTRFLELQGITSQFVNGLRVTTDQILDAVVKVVAGTVNRELVSAFSGASCAAVGISGLDGNLVTAEPLDPALGHVGRPVDSDPRVLEALLAARFLPVVACVAGDRQSRIYNVNADQMATACAVGFRADRLLFLTDVDGVRGASGSVQAELDGADCESLIQNGVAGGGMHAKLLAAMAALSGGVNEVRIAPGAADHVVERLLAGESLGTRIVPARVLLQ